MPETRVLSMTDLVDGLKRLESDVITKDRVTEFLSGAQVSDGSIRPYVTWSDQRYTRNLVFHDDLFEIMVLCWKSGQKTPIHTHNGQLGWTLVQRGHLEVVNFKWKGCNKPENQNVVGMDCLGGATEFDLDELTRLGCDADGAVSTVDKTQTIHRMINPDVDHEAAVSVHVYSKPFDSCIAFDLENHRCYRRQLVFDTEYGKPRVDPVAHR
ncbi:MAG: cysteine dioxygenase family protein [Planctomycetes bacterium]|nr:cysteine dioxygenase family protein [Planctomycetota bacterium]MBI3847097.1 cysteine dioxygenase family protein [Planctomycetota bacterium]